MPYFNWSIQVPTVDVKLYIAEIPLHVAGLALTLGFTAAIADGKSIGIITAADYTGLVLLPSIPIAIRIMLKLVMIETEGMMKKVWNILASLAFGVWFLLFFLKLQSSIPWSYVNVFIPLWIFFGVLFFGASMNGFLSYRQTKHAKYHDEDEEDDTRYR